MKLFFILYWGIFLVGAWAVRSYGAYHRQHVLRHEYAERHRRRIHTEPPRLHTERACLHAAHPRHQMNLF